MSRGEPLDEDLCGRPTAYYLERNKGETNGTSSK